MLGQGKNVWQAEIDAAAEVCPTSHIIIVPLQEADSLLSLYPLIALRLLTLWSAICRRGI